MGVKIRGGILLARKTFVIEYFGEDAWERVLKSMPLEDQQVLRAIIHVGWYPFETGKLLDQTIVDVLGRGDTGIFESIGAKSARENLSKAQKAFIQPGNPQAFMKQADTIYKFYYNIGRREYVSTGPNSGVLTTYDAETFSEVDCLTVIGWYKEALKMCGVKAVMMNEIQCRARGDKVCQYEVSWAL
ncbi:TIGR02265 family protein [bacterium]|nr:TIGR02265 family protein [bacterium]